MSLSPSQEKRMTEEKELPNSVLFLKKSLGVMKCRESLEQCWMILGVAKDAVEAINPIDKISLGKGFDPSMRQVTLSGDVVNSIESLYEAAKHAEKLFSEILRTILSNAGLNPDILSVAPLKRKDRAEEKARDDHDSREHGPGISWLFDIVRGKILCEDISDLDKALTAIISNSANLPYQIVRIKNRFKSPTYGGFRDVNMNIQVLFGQVHHICELQVHYSPIVKLGDSLDSHQYYEYFREYFRGGETAILERFSSIERLESYINVDELNCESIETIADAVISSGNLDDMRTSVELFENLSELYHARRIQDSIIELNKEKHGDEHLIL